MWGEGRAGRVNLDSTAPRQMAVNVLGTISASGQDGVTGTKFTLTLERTKTWMDYLSIRVFIHETVGGAGQWFPRVGKHVTWAVVSPVPVWRVSRVRHKDGGARKGWGSP